MRLTLSLIAPKRQASSFAGTIQSMLAITCPIIA
jgi:hypothetical protein